MHIPCTFLLLKVLFSRKFLEKKGEQMEPAKMQILEPGGLAIVSTPNMEYMAQAAYDELRKHIDNAAIDFHIVAYQKFSRDEVLPTITKNVRMKRVYLFYDFNGDSCHDAFVLQLTVSAIQNAGASSITLVMPFMPFMRQDRQGELREPISAKDFIGGYERYEKVERTITFDIHAEQTQTAFTHRSDLLRGHVVFVPWIKERFGDRLHDVVMVGPDAGSEKRVSKIAKRLGTARAFLTKERSGANVEMHEIHGASVAGKICIINDDIMDTCSTMIQAAAALKDKGAAEVILTGSHAVFGNKNGSSAYQKLAASGFQVVTTDSLRTEHHPWLTVLPLAKYMGHAILQNNIVDGSISELNEKGIEE
jgi:ribose-phosphate pyrophosphokinase